MPSSRGWGAQDKAKRIVNVEQGSGNIDSFKIPCSMSTFSIQLD
jgi:hypothetical protein